MKSINKSKNVLSCRGYLKRNSTISTYVLSRDLHIFPIAGFCTSMQIKCFCKWINLNCIIKNLIKHISVLRKYFWAKESRTLYKKIKKRNIIKFSDVIEIY